MTEAEKKKSSNYILYRQYLVLGSPFIDLQRI